MRSLVGLALVCAGAIAPAASATDLSGSAQIGIASDPVSAAARCADIRDSGADATLLSAIRPNIDARSGVYRFQNLDQNIAGERACGVESGFRVFGQRQTETRRFPDDPAEYAAFLTALARHQVDAGTGVRRYGIENEVEVVNHWEDTPQHYYDLLRIAYGAIKAGDPNAIVLDSSFSVAGLYRVRIAELYNSGRSAEALEVYKVMAGNIIGDEGRGANAITREDQLGAYVASPTVQRPLDFFRLLMANQDVFDAFQLHFYGPAERLPEIVDMLRRGGLTKPIETWELGHRYLDGRPFVEADWAAESSRLIATAIGEGSRFTILQLLIDRLADNMAYGITTAEGARRQAFFSYRTTARVLAGATAAERVRLPGGAAAYRYERPSGTVTGFWSISSEPRVGNALGLRATSAALTAGQAERSRVVATKGLRASAAPQWVEPILLEINRLGTKRARHLRLLITCPAASPLKHCGGTLRVRGKAGKRRVGLTKSAYRLRRGKQRTLSLRLEGPGRPTLVIAEAKPCPGGVKPCRSHLRLARSR